jgi:hypothetical protein
MYKKIRKAVIPAAGPRISLAFALAIVHSAAHAAVLTGRAVVCGYRLGGSHE